MRNFINNLYQNYLKLVVFVRALPDPLEVSFYGFLGTINALLIDTLQALEVNEVGAIIIAFATNILVYLRFKIDEQKSKIEK